jgi:Carboxypeptidase regulatory-like domain/TonB-dependent Receptor Plug Domain/TonB dependent receptor
MYRTILRFLSVALFGLVLIGFANPAHAQFRASVQGTLTDSAGAVVPDATVTLTSKETGRTQQATTSQEGFYRFSNLPPGQYILSGEKGGFRKSVLDIEVKAEETQGFDITLTSGEISETVTVTAAETATLQTENANVDRAITTQEVLRLPQFGRDPYELARLTPGVFGQGARASGGGAVNLPNTTGPGGSGTSIFQAENQVPISANGQRVSANNFQIDGVSTNSLNHGGAAVITPNQEAVKEVRILSSAYSAEYGRNSGAQILVVSQNGTNEYHGSGFFKYNNPGLNAFNELGTTIGASGFGRPERVENRFRQFGGSFGGPLHLPRFGEGGPAYISGKNRLFFFFSYEGLREDATNFSNQYVETPQFRNLIFSQRANSVTARVLSAQGMNPRIAALLPVGCGDFGNDPNRCRVVPGGLDIGSLVGQIGQYADGATNNLFDGIPDIQFAQISLPRSTEGNQYNARFDYTRGANTLAFSGFITRLQTLSSDSPGQGRPGGDIFFEPDSRSATLTFIRIISSTLINEARFNVTRFYTDQVASLSNTDLGVPRVEVEGFLPAGARIRFGAPRGENTPAIFAQNTYEFRDTLTWVNGSQAYKFGAEIRREQNNSNAVGGARPVFSFVGLFNLANDTPVFEAITTNPSTGLPTDNQRYLRSNVFAFFLQDDWKFRPNLSLNLGLRYEYFSPLREKRGQLTNFVLGPNLLRDARVEIREELYEPDRNNFAPRLGFAYSPAWFAARDRVVLRGGFGIAYNRTPTAVINNVRGNPPFFARNSPCCGFPGSPFAPSATGLPRILYAVSSDGSIFGYPTAAGLRQGVNPETNQVIGTNVEVYGTTPELPNAYVYTYSLEGQAELPFNLTGTLGFQGSAGRKLIRIVPYQHIFPSTGAQLPFDPIFIITPDVNTSYNAMNARLTHRLTRGLQFDAQYRWAKSIDTLSFEGPGFVTNQTFPQDQSEERGPSDYDVRHYFTLTSLYEFPYFRDQRGLARTLLDGWQINTIVTAHSGFPWTPMTRLPSLISPGGRRLSPIRPIAYLGGNLDGTSDDAFTRPEGNFPGGGRSYFNITGNVERPGIGRNSFRGPNYFNADLSLVKRTYLPFIKEGAYLDLRANFFNAFNLLNLENFAFGGAGTIIEDANFGRSPRGLAGRVVELQARFSF